MVAETSAQAEDALAALRVDYEPLPVVASLEDALEWTDLASIPAATWPRGSPSAWATRPGPGARPVVLRERFHASGRRHGHGDTRVAARWDADLGQVTVWSTTQAPQILRRLLARYLGLPEHAVRVVTQDIGGGFGPKAIIYAEDILVPFLAAPSAGRSGSSRHVASILIAVTQEARPVARRRGGAHAEGRIVALRDSLCTIAAPSSPGASSSPSSPR